MEIDTYVFVPLAHQMLGSVSRGTEKTEVLIKVLLSSISL